MKIGNERDEPGGADLLEYEKKRFLPHCNSRGDEYRFKRFLAACAGGKIFIRSMRWTLTVLVLLSFYDRFATSVRIYTSGNRR